MKSKVLTDELNLIVNPLIKKFTEATLENTPDYFYVAQASSTGKYHPECTCKKGGLIVHVKRAVCLANRLCDGYGFKGMDKDIVLSATILHDIAKTGQGSGSYDDFVNHPINAKNFFVPLDLDAETIEKIDGCIKNHMGLWTPDQIKKPLTEYSLLELLVYTADFYSATKVLALPIDTFEATEPVIEDLPF
jgi:HD superfamily phosphodiesterase